MPQPSLQHRCPREHYCNLPSHTAPRAAIFCFGPLATGRKSAFTSWELLILLCLENRSASAKPRWEGGVQGAVTPLCCSGAQLRGSELGRSRGGQAGWKRKCCWHEFLPHLGLWQMGPCKAPLDMDVISILISVGLGIQCSPGRSNPAAQVVIVPS